MDENEHTELMRDEDHRFWERELASFVPDRVFDAHSHLWHPDHQEMDAPGVPRIVGYREYRSLMEGLHPGRTVAGLFIPWPSKKRQFANRWVANEVQEDRISRGLFFVKPDDDPEWVRQEARQLGLRGLKCYHTMAKVKPSWEADIPDYLPERLVKVADEEGWVITLHMVKSRAVADPKNIHWIRHYCEKYPHIKLILAHSARGFQPAHNLEGLPQLTGLDNLYFDCSANCEPIAHQAILRIIGHRKLLYGTDCPVCFYRGRSVAAADTFLWLYGDTPIWGEKHTHIDPILIGLEHLRSLKWACWSERVGDRAVEDIFWNNAVDLLGIE